MPATTAYAACRLTARHAAHRHSTASNGALPGATVSYLVAGGARPPAPFRVPTQTTPPHVHAAIAVAFRHVAFAPAYLFGGIWWAGRRTNQRRAPCTSRSRIPGAFMAEERHLSRWRLPLRRHAFLIEAYMGCGAATFVRAQTERWHH